MNPKVDGKKKGNPTSHNRLTFRELTGHGGQHNTLVVLLDDEQLDSIEDQIRRLRSKRDQREAA